MAEETDSDDPTAWWEEVYRDDEEAPWETGRPQPAIVECSERGDIVGRVLDVGCGVGTNVLYLAKQGHEAVGIDFASAAIERARSRAERRDDDIDVSFEVADAFTLPDLELGSFGTVVDCGMLHTLDANERRRYADSLGAVLEPGGRVVALEFRVGAPADWGPIPLSDADLRGAFEDGWRVETVEETRFVTRVRPVPGILGVVERTL